MEFGLNHEIPSSPSPIGNQTTPTKNYFVTKEFGVSYDIKRVVPFGSNPVGSLDPLPSTKYYLVSKESGLNEVPFGPSPIGNPTTPTKNYFVNKEFRVNHDIKRLVPSGPNLAESLDPPVVELAFVNI